MELDQEAILYYADNPVEFVEDIIGAKPDDNQKIILQSVAMEPMTSVRSGHGIGKCLGIQSKRVVWGIG